MRFVKCAGKNLRVFFILFVCLSCAAGISSAAAQREAPSSRGMSISLKLSGGMGILFNGAGDLEKFRSGRKTMIDDYSGLPGYSPSFGWKKLSLLPDLNAEIIFNITPNFGVGFGSGIINATSKGNYSIQGSFTENPWWGTFTETETDLYTHSYKIQAIPINLTAYYFMPFGNSRKFNVYAYAGVGYYFGKLTHSYTENYEYQYTDDSWYYYNEQEIYQLTSTAREEMKRNTVGFRGGLGLEMKMTSSLSVGLEVFGRYVNFKNWAGDYSDSYTSRDRLWQELLGWYYDQPESGSSSEHGSLYIYDLKESILEKSYPTMWIWQNSPEATTISNVRKAAINLNAFGALISVRYRFDL
jgi:opacity protein-like surface antigen